mmetsp:Transcript_39404/g.104489  ORF Transcript_39404/g.104489 Transcript_39404/m.104489 type:complete len:180 (-) Transcript_39404:153-692(-)
MSCTILLSSDVCGQRRHQLDTKSVPVPCGSSVPLDVLQVNLQMTGDCESKYRLVFRGPSPEGCKATREQQVLPCLYASTTAGRFVRGSVTSRIQLWLQRAIFPSCSPLVCCRGFTENVIGTLNPLRGTMECLSRSSSAPRYQCAAVTGQSGDTDACSRTCLPLFVQAAGVASPPQPRRE